MTDERQPRAAADTAAELARLRAENSRLRDTLDALEHEVDDALREMAAAALRQRQIQAEIRAAETALGAIRSSNSWRALEALRRLGLNARGWRMRLAGGTRWKPRPRRRGVPDAVRQAAVGVNVAGYLAAESGLGEAARASIRTLRHAGLPFALNNVPGPQRALDPEFTAFVTDNPHPFNLVHLNADNMAWFAGERGAAYFRDRYTVGFWFWELSRFRPDWMGAFNVVDEVWMATRFACAAVRGVSPVPVVWMPLPVAAPPRRAVGRAHFGIPADRFAFLFTFDVSSQMERKNPLAVARAFRRSGTGRTRATLVLKFTNGHVDRLAVRRLQEETDGLSVLMLDGHMDRAELGALMGSCDCYVSLHRAEGFGLTMAEAMTLGKPVIATAYSGNVDFMTADTSCLVDYRLVPLTRDYGPYLRGFEWAEPDVDQAADAMKRMVESPDWAAELGSRGPAAIKRHLGLDPAADRYRRRLAAIQAGATETVDEDA